MAWHAIDRRTPQTTEDADGHRRDAGATAQEAGATVPLLSEALREKIRSFFPRYETKRATLLPALHLVQDALGHVGPQAMKEIAEVLEIPPSSVLDTMSFYTHFWDHAKGTKVIVACRSLSCNLTGAQAVLEALKAELGIDEHQTTPDGRYSLMTEECLAACDHGPCMLINEKLHKGVKPQDVKKLLNDPENQRISVERSALFDGPTGGGPAAAGSGPPVERGRTKEADA